MNLDDIRFQQERNIIQPMKWWLYCDQSSEAKFFLK